MGKSIRTMEAPTKTTGAPDHLSNEFPAGYSLTRCSPAELVSASPADDDDASGSVQLRGSLSTFETENRNSTGSESTLKGHFFCPKNGEYLSVHIEVDADPVAQLICERPRLHLRIKLQASGRVSQGRQAIPDVARPVPTSFWTRATTGTLSIGWGVAINEKLCKIRTIYAAVEVVKWPLANEGMLLPQGRVKVSEDESHEVANAQGSKHGDHEK